MTGQNKATVGTVAINTRDEQQSKDIAKSLSQPTLNTVFRQDQNFTCIDRYLWFNPKAKHIKCLYGSVLNTFRDGLCGGGQYIPQFSYYPDPFRTNEGKLVNLFQVIQTMKSGKLRELDRQIKEAAAIGDNGRKNQLKAQLPCIAHSGIFLPRNNASLKHPGFTYGLDIDNISNPDELLKKIIQDKKLEVLIASKSVSGKGVKAILFLRPLVFLRDEWTPEQYRGTYHQATDILSEYFKDCYGVQIDTQMKAISQPFYLFYAPDLFINKNYAQWI